MRLEDIGFYTLSDERARIAGPHSPMWRCELLITGACNFACPYCRGPRDGHGHMPTEQAHQTIRWWIDQGLLNLRLSGGEPTLHPGLLEIVRCSKLGGVERVAISTNGSASRGLYQVLVDAGVNDVSVSLDACCASQAESMSGGRDCYRIVTDNIRMLSKLTYVTVGIVVTDENRGDLARVVREAHDMGVADIRLIGAAQNDEPLIGLEDLYRDRGLLDAHPILRYRLGNLVKGVPLRGLRSGDSRRCWLIQDDSAVAGGYHYPCIIYLREGGRPIGQVSSEMRGERVEWARTHDTHNDPICKANCLDVCVAYNNQAQEAKTGCKSCAVNSRG